MKKDDDLKRSIFFSLLVHIVAFSLCFLRNFHFYSNSQVIMNVEIAGEGEMREAIERYTGGNGGEDHENLEQVNQNLEERDKIDTPLETQNIEYDKRLESLQKEIKTEDHTQSENLPIQNESESDTQDIANDENNHVGQNASQNDIEQDPIDEPTDDDAMSENQLQQIEKQHQKEELQRNLEEQKKLEEKERLEEQRRLEEKNKQEEQRKKLIAQKKAAKNKKRKALASVIKKVDQQKKKNKKRSKISNLLAKSKKVSEKKNNNFEKILNNSEKSLRLAMKAGDRLGSGTGRTGSGAGSLGAGVGLNGSDYDMISSQIYPHWVVPTGVKDAENFVVEIHVELTNSGEVIPSSVRVIDQSRYAKDSIYRAVADSARSAVLQASPLQISAEKVNLFREFTLRFNVKEALGG